MDIKKSINEILRNAILQEILSGFIKELEDKGKSNEIIQFIEENL